MHFCVLNRAFFVSNRAFLYWTMHLLSNLAFCVERVLYFITRHGKPTPLTWWRLSKMLINFRGFTFISRVGRVSHSCILEHINNALSTCDEDQFTFLLHVQGWKNCLYLYLPTLSRCTLVPTWAYHWPMFRKKPHNTSIIESPQSGLALCFHFVSTTATMTFASRTKIIWAKLYIFGTKYRSGKMYWVTFLWPWPKAMAVALINKNLLVCRVKWESLDQSLQNLVAKSLLSYSLFD